MHISIKHKGQRQLVTRTLGAGGDFDRFQVKKERKWKWSHSVVSDSLRGGFSRQEYWSGLPFLSPGDLPDPGIEPRSTSLQVDSLPSESPGKSRTLEWVAHPFSRGSSWPRVSCIVGGFFTSWAREAQALLKQYNLLLSQKLKSVFTDLDLREESNNVG